MSLPNMNGFENMVVDVQDEIYRQPSLTLDELNILGGLIDGQEALQQSIGRRLRTERYTNSIYDLSYGVEFEELYGMAMGFVQVDIARRIQEALLEDDRIIDVNVIETAIDKGNLYVTLNVISIHGNFRQEMVLSEWTN